MFKKSLVLVVSLAAASFSHGAVLFESGTFGATKSSWVSSTLGPQFIATRFTLTGDSNIDSIKVEGVFASTNPEQYRFNVSILSDNNGTVGSLVGSYQFSNMPVSNLYTGSQLDNPVYESTLTPTTAISLEAGTYWLSVASNNKVWGWSYSGEPDVRFASTANFDSYRYHDDGPLIFSLAGSSVPEPSALALGGLGLGLLMFRKRR
jgi:hypothetical protein